MAGGLLSRGEWLSSSDAADSLLWWCVGFLAFRGGSDSQVTLTDSTLVNNTATSGNGGAIIASSWANLPGLQLLAPAGGNFSISDRSGQLALQLQGKDSQPIMCCNNVINGTSAQDSSSQVVGLPLATAKAVVQQRMSAAGVLPNEDLLVDVVLYDAIGQRMKVPQSAVAVAVLSVQPVAASGTDPDTQARASFQSRVEFNAQKGVASFQNLRLYARPGRYAVGSVGSIVMCRQLQHISCQDCSSCQYCFQQHILSVHSLGGLKTTSE